MQGAGAALLSPAALDLVLAAFPPDRGRSTAISIWTSLGGLGGTVGAALGGLLVAGLGWRWVFTVNLPILGVAAAGVVALVGLRAGRAPQQPGARLDVAGAVSSTVGAGLLVAAAVLAPTADWPALLALVAGLGSLALLVRIESRAGTPLVPIGMLTASPAWCGNASLALNGAAFVGMFVLLATVLQTVRRLSPLTAGLAFVPMGAAAVAGALALGWLALAAGELPYPIGILPAIIAYGLSIPMVKATRFGLPAVASLAPWPEERLPRKIRGFGPSGRRCAATELLTCCSSLTNPWLVFRIRAAPRASRSCPSPSVRGLDGGYVAR